MSREHYKQSKAIISRDLFNKEDICGMSLNNLSNLNNTNFGLKKIIHNNAGNATYPKYSSCNEIDNPIPISINKNKNLESKSKEPEYELARSRLFEIMTRDQESQYAPFIAGIVIVNGECLGKFINYNFSINIRQTLGDLKNAIVSNNIQISKNLGLLNSVKFRLKYWTKTEYPTFRVENIHYCIPPYITKFSQLESDYDLNNDETLLSDIYLDYQYKLGKIIRNRPELINSKETPNAYAHVEKIYKEQKLWHYGNSGPDDAGYCDKAFSNAQNCEIDEKYRAYPYDNKSSVDSISWLVFNLVAEDM
jgi:hypothetical protein